MVVIVKLLASIGTVATIDSRAAALYRTCFRNFGIDEIVSFVHTLRRHWKKRLSTSSYQEIDRTCGLESRLEYNPPKPQKV